jgi:hypothetical protein
MKLIPSSLSSGLQSLSTSRLFCERSMRSSAATGGRLADSVAWASVPECRQIWNRTTRAFSTRGRSTGASCGGLRKPRRREQECAICVAGNFEAASLPTAWPQTAFRCSRSSRNDRAPSRVGRLPPRVRHLGRAAGRTIAGAKAHELQPPKGASVGGSRQGQRHLVHLLNGGLGFGVPLHRAETFLGPVFTNVP